MKDLKEFVDILIVLIVISGALWLDTRLFRFFFRWNHPPKTPASTNQGVGDQWNETTGLR
jgi:hypothetical protein